MFEQLTLNHALTNYGYLSSMFAQHDFVMAAQVAVGDTPTDRDIIALHVGRILQSCAVVENGIFRMIAARNDVQEFSSIQRTKRPAFRNVMCDVRKIVEASIGSKTAAFKNPKRLFSTLTEFDKIAAARSDLAHAEFVASGEIDGVKVAILSNEGIEGSNFQARKVQIMQVADIVALDKAAYRLANTLRQILTNQIDYKPTT